MHLVTKLPSDIDVLIIMPMHQVRRLQDRCFRPPGAYAGNFINWRRIEDVFDDPTVLKLFLDYVDSIWKGNDLVSTHSLVLELPGWLGWESTALRSKYGDDLLERFRLNRKTTALRLAPDKTDLLSPKTKLLTLVFSVENRRGSPAVTLHSLYPGEDIGELEGDITEREGRIFFEWNHPGEE